MLKRTPSPTAALLLTLFLGGGGVSGALDVILYHGGANGQSVQRHLDPAGGCGSHREHCVLPRATTPTLLLSAVPRAVTCDDLASVPPTEHRGRLGSLPLQTLSNPRAPPSV